MSAKYVESAKAEIAKKIKDNLDYAKANPYPSAELTKALTALGSESYLFKTYSSSGLLLSRENTSPEDLKNAHAEADKFSPGLAKKLYTGQEGLERAKIATDELPLIDPKKEIDFAIPLLLALPRMSQITILSYPPSQFVKMVKDSFNLDLGISKHIPHGLVQSAFAEAFITANDPASAINQNTATSGSASSNQNKPAGAINETLKTDLTDKTAAQANSSSAINEKTKSALDKTTVSNLDGSVTNKEASIVEEKPNLSQNKSSAINVNLEPASSSIIKLPATSSSVPTVSNTSTSNIINTNTSQESTVNNQNSSVSSENVSTSGNIVKVENNNTDQSSNTINDSPKKKSFLSNVGSALKTAGNVLNLPSGKDLRELGTGIFGVTAANVKSRLTEIKDSFSNNTNPINFDKKIKQEVPKKDNIINSETSKESEKNIVNTETSEESRQNIVNTSASSNVNSESMSAVNVDANKPAMSQEIIPKVATATQPLNTQVSSVKQESLASTNQAQPTTIKNTTASPKTESASINKPASVNVDMNQVVQAVTRLQQTLMSGIEVTIKEA